MDNISKISNLTTNKKEFALFFICRGDFIFPLATTVLSLLESNPEFNEVIIVATGGKNYFNPHYEEVFKNIYSKISFIEFSDDYILNKLNSENIITNCILTLYARYFAFDLLDKYKQILILDTDILINNNILKFKELYGCGYAARKTTIKLEKMFLYNLKHDNLDLTNLFTLNTGVLYIDDTLKLRSIDLLRNHQRYSSLKRMTTRAGMEEHIICISLYEYSTTFTNLSYLYHSYPTSADCDSAIIIHSKEAAKFWNSSILNFAFPQWNKYFNQWKNILSNEIKKGAVTEIEIPKLNLSTEYFEFPTESWKIMSIFAREERWKTFWKNSCLQGFNIIPIDISNRLKKRNFLIKDLNLPFTVTLSSPKSYTFIFACDTDDIEIKTFILSLSKSFQSITRDKKIEFTIQDKNISDFFIKINSCTSSI